MVFQMKYFFNDPFQYLFYYGIMGHNKTLNPEERNEFRQTHSNLEIK